MYWFPIIIIYCYKWLIYTTPDYKRQGKRDQVHHHNAECAAYSTIYIIHVRLVTFNCWCDTLMDYAASASASHHLHPQSIYAHQCNCVIKYRSNFIANGSRASFVYTQRHQVPYFHRFYSKLDFGMAADDPIISILNYYQLNRELHCLIHLIVAEKCRREIQCSLASSASDFSHREHRCTNRCKTRFLHEFFNVIFLHRIIIITILSASQLFSECEMLMCIGRVCAKLRI